MFVIGLTGGIGSGKSTVATLFLKKGITVIDTDQLAREVIEPDRIAFKKIIDYFGKAILQDSGKIDRAKLRTIVFHNPKQRLWLEKLLHPLIRELMAQHIKEAKSPYCIAVIPLLFETTPNPLINRILVVDSPEPLQIKRVLARDASSEAEIKKIIASQISREKRLKGADDVILNDGLLEDLQLQVDQLHEQYLSLSAASL